MVSLSGVGELGLRPLAEGSKRGCVVEGGVSILSLLLLLTRFHGRLFHRLCRERRRDPTERTRATIHTHSTGCNGSGPRSGRNLATWSLENVQQGIENGA